MERQCCKICDFRQYDKKNRKNICRCKESENYVLEVALLDVCEYFDKIKEGSNDEKFNKTTN